MCRIFRSIRVFCLLLSGLAISAHMIIPHDHHLFDTLSCHRNSCPVSDSKPVHHTGFPVHCHVFNDLAVEEFATLVLKKNTHSGFISVIWVHDFPAHELNIACIKIFDSRKPFPDTCIPVSCLLRAPPSVV